jgi:hypothetical protein
MAGNGSQQRKPGVKTAVEDVKALATVLAMEAESILGRRTARVLGALALFAAVGGILVWYIAPSGAAEKQALVVTLAQILGGTALLSGLYFTWRTLQVNREGQITERFTRAIDQLGKIENGQKLFEIRVGGIYALERIARESEEDYEPIIEVLTAYVRQNAPLKPGKETAEEESDKEERTPDPDIQAITTVLRRLTRLHGQGQPGRLDLHDTDLQGANLQEAILYRANLDGANLQYADLTGANLQASLDGANLQGAFLYRANLQGALLEEANLQGALLEEANLQYAELQEANLQGANLREANLQGANLYQANLQGVYLQLAVDLIQAQIEVALGNKDTRLPENLDPPAMWSKDLEEQRRILDNRVWEDPP